MGLNIEYEPLRSQILNQEKVPSIEEFINIVLEEESRMKLVPNAPKEEASVILATKGKIHVLEEKAPQLGSGGKQQKFENLFCVYCKKWNHTKETCFKLKNRNQRQAHAATAQVDEGLDGNVSCSNQPKKTTQ